MRRCAIVGISTVTALGQTIDETFNNIKQRKSGIKEIEHISTENCYAKVGAEIPEVDIANAIIKSYYPTYTSNRGKSNKVVYSKYNQEKLGFFLDSCFPNKYYHILGRAVEDALKDAKIKYTDIDSHNDIIINATCSGDSDLAAKSGDDINQSVFGIHVSTMNALIPITMYATDNNITVSTACSSGTAALSMASNFVKSKYRRAIVLGADILSDVHYAGFLSLKSLDKDPCKPFSNPQGLTLGDGAAVLVLEEEEFAKSRKAKIYGYIDGSAIGLEANHITSPDETGTSQANIMSQAIQDAGLKPEDIDFVYAHGTGTLKNDTAESLAMLKTFKSDHMPYLGSSKSAIGHTLGASGLINAALSCKMIQENCLLPTVGFTGEGIIKDVNYKSDRETILYPDSILCNSFAFGGNDASIVISKSPHGSKDVSENNIDNCYILGSNKFKVPFKDNNINLPKEEYLALGMDLQNVRKMDGYSRCKCISGIRALQNANIKITKDNNTRIGILGLSVLGTPTVRYEGFLKPIREKGNNYGDSMLFPNSVQNAGDGWLSICTGIKGYSLSTLCIPKAELLYEYASFLINNDYLDKILISNCQVEDEFLTCSSVVLGKSEFLPKNSPLRKNTFLNLIRVAGTINQLVDDIIPYNKSLAELEKIL